MVLAFLKTLQSCSLPISAGRKIERSLSAKRKENTDSFIPTKPMLVKSKTLDQPPSDESWDSQSKSFSIIIKT